MRKKITIAFFLSLTIGFSSCKKETGKSSDLVTVVVDYTTKQPIPGLKVHFVVGGFRIYNPMEPWGFYNADTTTGAPRVVNYYSKDSTVTDANGKFSYHYTPVVIPLEGSIAPTATILSETLLHLSTSRYQDTLFTDPVSSLTVNLQKSFPAVSTDTVYQQLIFLAEPNQPGTLKFPFLRAQIGLTNASYTTRFCYAIHKRVKIEWRHYRNGLQNAGVDTITLNPYSNTTVNINY